MTLDRESVTKLNAEINYYLNQQYTLLLAAVTLVGAVLAWVTRLVDPAQLASMDSVYLGAASLTLFLILMSIVEARLDVAIAICAVYLRLTGASQWEIDVVRFKAASRSHASVTSRGTYYLLLGLFALGWPFALSYLTFGQIPLTPIAAAHVVITIAYLTFVFLILPWLVRLRVAEIESAWRQALDLQKS
jgi:hypothetical protein